MCGANAGSGVGGTCGKGDAKKVGFPPPFNPYSIFELDSWSGRWTVQQNCEIIWLQFISSWRIYEKNRKALIYGEEGF
jgi:hypothetical protein